MIMNKKKVKAHKPHNHHIDSEDRKIGRHRIIFLILMVIIGAILAIYQVNRS